MSLRRLIVGLLVVSILTAAGYWAYLEYLAPNSAVEATAVPDPNETAVDIGVDVVSAEGVIVPARHAALAFQLGGRVAEVPVSVGDQIAAGDVLLRLEGQDLESAVKQAEAQLALSEANQQAAMAGLAAARAGVDAAQTGVSAADAQLALVQSDPLLEEIEVVEQGIAVAQAGIDQASANRDAVLEIPASQIRAAEARVAAAIAEQRVLQDQYDTLTRSQVGGTPEEQARFALNAATANSNAAQAALDELNAGATSAQRRAAAAAVAVAEAQRDAAQTQLDLLLAGAKAEQVAILAVGVLQAESTVSQAEAAAAQAETAVAQAEAGIAVAQAALASARTALDKMVLTAPFAGVVVDIAVGLGEIAPPGVPVLILADMSTWQVETTDLTERDVVTVAVGQPVEVRVDAIPDVAIRATVADIAKTSSVSRGDVVYRVDITLQDALALPLRWGMTVFADIDVAQ